MKGRPLRLVWICSFVLIVAVLCGACLGFDRISEKSQSAGDSRCGSAEAYYQWLQGCLDGIEKDLPHITESAEAAARLHVQEGYGIVALGDPGFVTEISGRSGGLMTLHAADRSRGPGSKSIVLLAPRDDALEKDLLAAAAHLKNGNMVVVFVRRSVLEHALGEGYEFSSAIENHAAEHGGLYPGPDGTWVVPTDTTANIAAGWTWTGEFVAACTRLGKMPTMYQGFAVPGGPERAQTLRNKKFHDFTPEKVPQGRLGGAFLGELRKDLAAFHEHEMDKVRKLADLAVKTQKEGRGVYVFAHSHALVFDVGCAHDPGYFKQINKDWFTTRPDIELKAGDLVFGLGFDTIFRGKEWSNFDDKARKAGATLVWSITDYKKEEIQAIPPGEMLIDQHWDFGDAVVEVPGYDIKILPTSGVIVEQIMWGLNAEVHGLLCAGAKSKTKAS